ERIALTALVGGLERPGEVGLLLADARLGRVSLLPQCLQISLGTLAFVIQLAQLAHRTTDRAFGLA
ncbi:MAG: hypothetical protein ACYC0G_09390, partial [Thiobacillus sp.]